MKKILIITTALIAVGVIATGAQAADKVKLELGGYSKWFVVGMWQKESYNRATGESYNNVDVMGQTEVHFSGSTTLNNGLDVGVFTAMRAGGDTAGIDRESIIDRAYVYVASGYGKLILGVLENVSHLLHVQAPESIGQWGEYGLLTNSSTLENPGNFGLNSNGLQSTSILPDKGYGKYENITYITPTFYGLTVGASYVPNNAKNVRGPVDTRGFAHDTFVVGANYTNRFGDVGLKTSFGWARTTYGMGIPGMGEESLSGQKVNYFNTGLNLSYAGFTLGGSFRWNVHDVKNGGLLAIPIDPVGTTLNGHALDAGLMYDGGVWATSISYFWSRAPEKSRTNWGERAEVDILQASAKYILGPGIELQGMVGLAELTGSGKPYGGFETGPWSRNKGVMVMSGIAIQF